MKRILTIAIATFFTLTVFAQTELETINTAKKLVTNKKYNEAFKTLQDFDYTNEKPDIVLLKEEIALNYFVSSIMHGMFTFKDLEENENISDYRGKSGSFQMYNFSIDTELEKLIKIYPNNYKLYKGLGDFYNEVLLKYGNEWTKNEQTLSNLIIKNYQIVIEHNIADDKVFFTTGLQYLTQNKYKDAIPLFLKSLELNNKNADANYNLAYAYLYIEDRQNALKYAKLSLDLYDDEELKSDAARMTAQIYVELKDKVNAIKYYELADNIEGENYYNLKPLLSIYVETDNQKKHELLNSFFNLAPEKPTIYNDLTYIYNDSNKIKELIEFFKSKIQTYQNDKKVLGNLYFYLGRIYIDIDKKIAKEYLLNSKSIFSDVYNKDNQVFKAIEEGIKKTK